MVRGSGEGLVGVLRLSRSALIRWEPFLFFLPPLLGAGLRADWSWRGRVFRSYLYAPTSCCRCLQFIYYWKLDYNLVLQGLYDLPPNHKSEIYKSQAGSVRNLDHGQGLEGEAERESMVKAWRERKRVVCAAVSRFPAEHGSRQREPRRRRVSPSIRTPARATCPLRRLSTRVPLHFRAKGNKILPGAPICTPRDPWRRPRR